MMNEPKKKKLMEAEVNIKTLYRLFKRCFKHPTNTVTKWIWNFINSDYTPIFASRPSTSGMDRIKIGSPRTSGRNSGIGRRTYASIKGCCGLKRNGFLR